MNKTVGVVGLGIMGGAIASSLASANFTVIGFDIDCARQHDLSIQGIHAAESLPELVNSVDTILTSLPDAAALYRTARVIADRTSAAKTVVEASTLSLDDKLEIKRQLTSRQHMVLDCPTSGTGAQARTKDLVVYASGDAAKVAELEELFLAFARKIFDVGEFGNGSRVKLVANLLVAINNVATAEAMVLAERAGLDLEKIVEWIAAGAGSSRIFEKRAPLMAKRRYMPATMKLSVWQKDLDIISGFANELRSSTPLFRATLPVYAAAMAARAPDEDTAPVFAVVEQMVAE